MKLILFIVLFVVLQVPSAGQDHIPELKDYQDFMKSKTLVLLEKNPMSAFNIVIKDVMENSWIITPYQFIDDDEFEIYRNNPDYSILMITKASFKRDKTNARYNFLSLLMGQNDTRVGDMPDLCSIPLAYARVVDDNYTYKIEAFVRFLQNHVKLMLADPSLIGKNPFRYYNRNMKDNLSNKTLYLTQSDLAREINTEAKIEDVYPHRFEIVSREDIAEAISEKREDIVFLHKVGPENTRLRARVYKILVGAGDPHFYYFNYRMMRKAEDDAFEKRDLRKIR